MFIQVKMFLMILLAENCFIPNVPKRSNLITNNNPNVASEWAFVSWGTINSATQRETSTWVLTSLGKYSVCSKWATVSHNLYQQQTARTAGDSHVWHTLIHYIEDLYIHIFFYIWNKRIREIITLSPIPQIIILFKNTEKKL